MAEKLTGQTIVFQNPPRIISHASVVGRDEGKGPYGKSFDLVYDNAKCGKESWEKAEKKMVSDAIELAMGKGSLAANNIDLLIGGDLLNQIITANFLARDLDIPFLGVYGACATLVEGMALGAALLDGGFADCTLIFASSHYQTAERQYRTPLEYGAQYPPYKQWTVTGAGAYTLGWLGGEAQLTQATFGSVIDLGVNDPNDMGSAMAPAAADTIIQHFIDLQRGPQDYDLILSGDLGEVGKSLLIELLLEKNLSVKKKLQDCGALIFKGLKGYGAGGSGVGATATMLGSMLIPRLVSGELKRVLLVGTGALLSPVTVKQNESIPCIAHALTVEKIPGG